MLRSYDNRVRQTSRSPWLYENWDHIKADTKHILLVQDPTNTHMAFRDETYYQESTLFRDDDMGGQIQVIAVPYIPGNHVCKSPKQALSLVAFMKLLHESGNVHGDIRAFNIVFDDDNKAALIDFDFGGRENTVKYPPGYVSALGDGLRIGEPCVEISKEHDIHALAHVLGLLHTLSEEESADQAVTFLRLGRSKTLEELEHRSRNLLTQGARFLPREHFQKLLDKQIPTGKTEGQIETGAAVTPSKEIKSGPKGVKRDRGETTSEAGS